MNERAGKSLNVIAAVAEENRAARVDLNYADAVAYLRGEVLHLPADAPRGFVEVCFCGHRLGQVKNIGQRANNLYPTEWRIKSTHVPTDYQPVITTV
jgi:NOL1/NOP2/fmu family ribosome biogenesis protein